MRSPWHLLAVVGSTAVKMKSEEGSGRGTHVVTGPLYLRGTFERVIRLVDSGCIITLDESTARIGVAIHGMSNTDLSCKFRAFFSRDFACRKVVSCC